MKTPLIPLALIVGLVAGFVAGQAKGRTDHLLDQPVADHDGFGRVVDDCRFELHMARRRCFTPDDLAPRVATALRADGWQVGEAECKGCDPGFTQLVMRRP